MVVHPGPFGIAPTPTGAADVAISQPSSVLYTTKRTFAKVQLLITLLVLIYMWLGGARADAYTDALQVCLIVGTLGASMIWLLASGQAKSLLHDAQQNSANLFRLPDAKTSAMLIFGLCILPIFSLHTDAGIHQRLLLARDDKSARDGTLLAAILYVVFGVLLVAILLLAQGASLTLHSPDDVLLSFAQSTLPSVLQVLLIIAILSAVSSTLDSEVILVSTMVVNDVLWA